MALRRGRLNMKLRVFLSRLVATITGAPRYFPSEKWEGLDWSEGRLYTHDAFRILEWVFGRRYGVRQEVSFSSINGENEVIYHTFESKCWKLETDIRDALKRIVVPVRVVAFQAVGAAGMAFNIPSFIHLATVEANNGTNTGGASSINISLTIGGAGRVCLFSRQTYNPPAPSWTYTGGSITSLGSGSNNAGGYTNNPSSGSTTLTLNSNSGSPFMSLIGAAFSGVTGVGSTGSGSSSISLSVASNSNVCAATFHNPTGSTPSNITTSQTMIQTVGSVYGGIAWNQTLGNGGVTFTPTGGGVTLVTYGLELLNPVASMMFAFFGATAGAPAR